MDIYEQAEKIENQQDFILFLKLLKDDFRENFSAWENENLASFLEGLAGYNMDKEQGGISWKIVAEMLLAAKVYE
ncbi:MAG: hypothetical protein JXR03_21545 [Cyclobacteriaceae bacterium]